MNNEKFGRKIIICIHIIFLNIVSTATAQIFFTSGKIEGIYWKSYVGAWTENNSDYILNKGAGYALVKGKTFLNFTYELKLSLPKSGNGGMLFNVLDPVVGINSFNGFYIALDEIKDSVFLFKISKHTESHNEKKKVKIVAVPFKISAKIPYQIRLVKNVKLIDIYINDQHLLSVTDNGLTMAGIGILADNPHTIFSQISIKPIEEIMQDWSWVRGAIYLPTNCVNPIQQWEEFDSKINDRELLYASVYGFNLVKVNIHYLVYEKDKLKFLDDLEIFLSLADKHHLKTVITFFDDLWDPNPHLGIQEGPIPGSHNKRWVQCPGRMIKMNYFEFKNNLKSYVQDIVNAHKNDLRIAFWEAYNEPGFLMKDRELEITKILLNDTRIWIKETGTKIPLIATADPDFIGGGFSDFYSWHSYDRSYGGPRGPEVIVTECLNRADQTVAGLVQNFAYKSTGFIIWELGIGRDNSRFHWLSKIGSPEPSMPFQGFIYPDGHPWDTNEVALIRGHLDDMPVFNARYFTGEFEHEKKWSFTPCIDFDLGDENGTGSPDPSIGIEKDYFSIRWTGQILTDKAGKYSFYIETDNIARVWINGNQILNEKHKGEELHSSIDLDEKKIYDIKIDYIHETGPSKMHVYWSGPEFEKTLLPGRRINANTLITKESMFSTE